jgi:hypothetical protein
LKDFVGNNVKLVILFFSEIITGIFYVALIADMCCDDSCFGDSGSKWLTVLNPSMLNTIESVVLHCGAKKLLAVHYSLYSLLCIKNVKDAFQNILWVL